MVQKNRLILQCVIFLKQFILANVEVKQRLPYTKGKKNNTII